jgi:DNA invertase Pin-like site-specific DNA recombinase
MDSGGMAELGYVRVSTSRQKLDAQVDALTAAGVPRERIWSDKMSGARKDRPGLAALLDYAREGDTVVVVALDRLGRSLSGIVHTIEDFNERKILLRSLREGVDFSTSMGKMVAGIFASLATYERELIIERSQVAREAARARGAQPGRPRVITDEQLDTVRTLRTAGKPMAQICTQLGLKRSTVYKELAERGEPA